MRDDKLYLAHISQALARIERYIAGGRDEFMASTLIQDAVLRNLQTLGEAVKDLPADWKAAHPSVPWSSIIGFRNVGTHNYLFLDMERVWDVVANYLPTLKPVILVMLQEVEDE